MTHADHDHRRVIAIDGPAAAGKTTVARLLADRVGGMLFDTGALYRAVTLAVIRAGIAPADAAAATAIAERAAIDLRPASVADGRLADVLLDGEDVSWAIRGGDIDANVSVVSAHPGVRAALLPVQRRIADSRCVVMVGRDIATVVVPDAGAKIYLDASVAERARRRGAELRDRGVEVTDTQVAAELAERDRIDSTREVAPLRSAPGAIILDTDGLSIAAVVERLVTIVDDAWQRLGLPGVSA
jgi:cytidylate kinase